LEYWYKWKIFHSKSLRFDSIEQPSEVSTVIGEAKRRILRSNKYSNASKNLESTSFREFKENYFENNPKRKKKFIQK